MAFQIADLFEHVADAVGARVALVDDRGAQLTYPELDRAANRCAHALDAHGVAVGDHVGLALHNSIEHVVAMLGCYKRRAVPVNVNYRYTSRELDHLATDGRLVALLHDDDLTDAVSGMAHAPRVTMPLAELLREDHPDTRDFAPRSGDDHYILYTGGTTGLPKGVVWRQEDIFFAAMGGGNPGGPALERPEDIGAAVLANPAQRIRPFLPAGHPGPARLVALSLGPLVHASGQWGALGTLLGGGTLVINTQRHMDLGNVVELVEREQIAMLTLVGDASARPLLDALRSRTYDTSSLLLLGSGGSILSGDVKSALLDALPTVLAILEAIGSSESPSQAVSVVTRDSAPTSGQSLTFAPKPETLILDDHLRPIEPGRGIAGRLATRGRVPIGYLGDPERTARTIVELDGMRWVLPGDYAIADADGTIHLLGRGSLCINTGGEKVYPEEVEAVLKQHPSVADVLVVGRPDARYGQRVVAVVAPHDAAEPPSLDSVQEHARPLLAGYKLPRALVLVDAVQRSAAGKGDYAWAQEVAAAAFP